MAKTHCSYYAVGLCRSCGWLERGYDEQLRCKTTACEQALTPLFGADGEWLPSQASPLQGMRNKAKMAVGGSSAEPTLGLVELHREPVDLSECLLYPASLRGYFPLLKQFIQLARLDPYRPEQRTGELKFVLLTEPWPGQPVMLRWVLRSKEAVDRIAKHLPWLQQRLPAGSVISVNLQPEHKAILEGAEEILLSQERWLPVVFNQHRLLFGTQSFLQTNSSVAEALYAQAASWIDALAPRSVLDLYCGVGAFAFHAAGPRRRVRGVEISAEAIAAAQAACNPDAGMQIDFRCADAGQSLPIDELFELIVVNPPRRGLDSRLCQAIEASNCPSLLYSSCNLDSLVRDLQQLRGYRVRKAQLFDMFPHTRHFEILTLLERA